MVLSEVSRSVVEIMVVCCTIEVGSGGGALRGDGKERNVVEIVTVCKSSCSLSDVFFSIELPALFGESRRGEWSEGRPASVGCPSVGSACKRACT